MEGASSGQNLHTNPLFFVDLYINAIVDIRDGYNDCRRLFLRDLCENKRCPCRDVHLRRWEWSISKGWPRWKSTYLHPILTTIPFQGGGREYHGSVNAIKSTKLLLVTRKNDLIVSCLLNPNAIIRKGLGGMEVKHKQETRSLKHYNLIDLNKIKWCK